MNDPAGPIGYVSTAAATGSPRATAAVASTVGAVGYLNMLPYFHLGDVPVFRTPRALNDSARACLVTAACTSAVAGLRAGWKPLVPLLGVGASGVVRSVFLEPVPFLASDQAAWDALPGRLAGALGRADDRGGAVLTPSPRRVALFSSGASEHSEWLARTLLEAAGFLVRVEYEPRLTQLSERELRDLVQARRAGDLAALLVIGDPALARVLRAPQVPRLDLAELWRSATGLPCVFACWFQCDPTAPEGEMSKARATLEANLEAWEAAPSHARRSAIVRFLGTDALSRLDFYESYLEGITYAFDAPYARTLELYAGLLRST